MRQLTALAWKEWHEVRAFLWIALGVFVGLPVIAGVEAMIQLSKRFEISATPWVLAFGGVLAIFVAVGATCRDLGGRVEDFWRSRPVGIWRWLIVKYAVGLTVVVVACVIPITVEFLVDRRNHPGSEPLSMAQMAGMFLALMGWFLAILSPIFSVGFLAGCLVRRAAHAAMLAFAATLLIFLAPVVLPPLRWFSPEAIIYGDFLASVAVGLSGIAFVALAVALIAVWRGWRVESGRKMMYSAVALTFLILFSSAAFQLGTNMPVLQQVALEPREYATLVQCAGNHGYIVTQRLGDIAEFSSTVRTFELTASGIVMGPTRPTIPFSAGQWGEVSPPGHPEISYQARDPGDANGDSIGYLEIHYYDTNQSATVSLWDTRFHPATLFENQMHSFYDRPVCYVWNDRLYVMGQRLVTLDISDPVMRLPRVISTAPFSYAFMTEGGINSGGSSSEFTVSHWPDYKLPAKWLMILPPIPGLPAKQRLEARLAINHWLCFDGEYLCQLFGDDLIAFRLTKLTDTKAEFEPIGQYQPTILETAFGRVDYSNDLRIVDGLLYTDSESRRWGGPGGAIRMNPHISVFDLRGAHPLRLVGHFAAQGAGPMCVLPDGRMIVAGAKLWLVGPPPGYPAK